MPIRLLRTLVTALLFLVTASMFGHAAELEAETLFDSTKLMKVEIEIPEKDWDTLRRQARSRGGGFAAMFSNTSDKPFSYFKADVKVNGVKIPSVGIRKKGFIGSLDETRPSLKIKFSEFQEQQPVKGLDRLTLNNNKQDTALVSQFLTYKVFNDAGVQAPRVSLAKVSVNGENLGIYSHVESFKKPFLEDRYGDSSGNLYEGTLADFYTKAVEKLESKTDTKTTDDKDAMRLAELLSSEEDLPMDEIDRLVNVDSFLKFWCIESLIGFWDGYTQNQNNFFVYDNPSDGKFYFMPWGADSSFTAGGGPFGRFGGSPKSNAVKAESMLSNRLYHAPGIPARYKATLLKVLEEAWDENELVAEVDRLEKLTDGHRHKNQMPRGDSNGGWGRGRGSTMETVRDFIRERRETIMEELNDDWPAELSARPRKPMYTINVGTAQGKLATQWSKSDDADEEGSVSELKLQMGDEAVTLEDVSVKAGPMQMRGFGRRGGGGRGEGGGRPAWTPPTTIVINGKRASDGETVSITLTVDSDSLKSPTKEPIRVSGSHSVGQRSGFGFGRGPGQMIEGELLLDKAGSSEGDPVVGSFNVKIVEMHGGFMDRFRGR